MKKLIVFYGAGATYDSNFNVKINSEKSFLPPMDKNFFETEIVQEIMVDDNYQAIKFFIKNLIPLNSKLSLEDLWSNVSLNLRQLRFKTYDWKKETGKYLINYSKYYGDYYPYSDYLTESFTSGPIGNRSTQNTPIYNWKKFLGDCERDLKRLIYNCYSKLSIEDNKNSNYEIMHNIIKDFDLNILGYVSFNYDLALEKSLSNYNYLDVNIDIRNPYYIQNFPFSLILKLHGSLNWQNTSSSSDIIFEDTEIEPEYPTDTLSANRYIEPGIVPPTIFKEIINHKSDENEPLSRLLFTQWKSVIRLLSEADKVIIVGYSFPLTDYHVQRIFQIANMLRRGNDKESQKLLYCAGCDNKKDLLVERLSSITQIRNEDIRTYNKFSKLIQSRTLKSFLKE